VGRMYGGDGEEMCMWNVYVGLYVVYMSVCEQVRWFSDVFHLQYATFVGLGTSRGVIWVC